MKMIRKMIMMRRLKSKIELFNNVIFLYIKINDNKMRCFNNEHLECLSNLFMKFLLKILFYYSAIIKIPSSGEFTVKYE